MNTFDKKVAVVTGASSGIGRETVLSLIKAGYQVHAGARRLDAMRELENAGAYLHHVDLTNSENIDAFVADQSRIYISTGLHRAKSRYSVEDCLLPLVLQAHPACNATASAGLSKFHPDY